MYNGNVGAARFPDFSPISNLESWCKIYFGSGWSLSFLARNSSAFFSCRLKHLLTQTGFLACSASILPRSQAVRQCAFAKRPVQIRERPARRSAWPGVLAKYFVRVWTGASKWLAEKLECRNVLPSFLAGSSKAHEGRGCRGRSVHASAHICAAISYSAEIRRALLGKITETNLGKK